MTEIKEKTTIKQQGNFFIAKKGKTIISKEKVSDFKNDRAFKAFIQRKGYLVGSEIYLKKSADIKQFKDFVAIETSQFVKPNPKKVDMFRVIALSHANMDSRIIVASSGFFRDFDQESREAAEQQALFNLAVRFVFIEKKFEVTDADLVDEFEEDINIKMEQLSMNVKYKYVYNSMPFN